MEANQPIKLLDIGAMQDFLASMKILYPQLEVTTIDSLNKRINFLHYLPIGTWRCSFHWRAEDFVHKNFRAQFDIK